MKKIMIIAYHFPPDSAVGGLRPARFARHLTSFGWEPLVLTAKDRYREQLDRERLKGIQDIPVIKTTELPAIRHFYLDLKKYFSLSDSENAGDAGANETAPQSTRETLRQKLKRYFISLFITLPDLNANWILPAALRAAFEIKRRKIDYILTTSPPHSAHMAGLIARELTGVKWAADFRDPWIDIIQEKSPGVRSRLSDKAEHWMEDQVIRKADKIITTTKELRNAMQSRYPAEIRRKFIYIPNGIDLGGPSCGQVAEKFGKFTITYAGSLYAGRSVEPLFRAVKKLIDENRVKPSDISIKLFGNCDFMNDTPTTAVAEAYGLTGSVEVSGYVPYTEALQIMGRSHLLLLMIPSKHRLCIPAKVYDYFGVGSKILALADGGSIEEILRTTGSGKAFSPSDINGISGYIIELMNSGDTHLPKNNCNRFEQFDIRLLTGRLAGELAATPDHGGSAAGLKQLQATNKPGRRL